MCPLPRTIDDVDQGVDSLQLTNAGQVDLASSDHEAVHCGFFLWVWIIYGCFRFPALVRVRLEYGARWGKYIGIICVKTDCDSNLEG